MKKLMAMLVLMLAGGTVYAAGDAAAGETKAATCAGCHGVDGNSVVPAFPKLAGQGERYLSKQLMDIQAGTRPVVEMTGLLDALSPQDLQDIAAYYAAQQVSIGAADPELVELGEKLYRAGDAKRNIPACTACHSPTGAGIAAAGFPALQGQHADYTQKQLEHFRSGERKNDGETRVMRSVAALLSDQEIKALASYLSGLH